MDVKNICEIKVNNNIMINAVNEPNTETDIQEYDIENYKPFFLNLKLNLPDHSKELEIADNVINSLTKEIRLSGFTKTVTEEEYRKKYQKLIDTLEYLGELSVPVFEVEEYIEDLYLMTYKKNPQFTKKLWYAHYAQLHYPYTNLKEKCFRLLTSLDKRYLKKFDKLPKYDN
ncbi:MAG: hypothetical protein ACOCVF_00925 [bacterium]